MDTKFQPKVTSEHCPEMENMFLCIYQDERNGYGHIRVRPVYLRHINNDTETGTQSTRMELYSDSLYDNSIIYHWFVISCQYDLDGDIRDNRQPYAFRAQYENVEFGLRDMEKIERRMKYLRWLNNRVEKVFQKYGYAGENFGRYVAVIAAEMNANGFVIQTGDRDSAVKTYEHVHVDHNVEGYINKAIETGVLVR